MNKRIVKLNTTTKDVDIFNVLGLKLSSMEKFIPASHAIFKQKEINESNINLFIKKFNEKIVSCGYTEGSFIILSPKLDKIDLTYEEYKIVKKMAEDAGWELGFCDFPRKYYSLRKH